VQDLLVRILAKAYCTMRMRESVGWARELLVGKAITGISAFV
jgi:hypothetical protein